MADLNKTKGFHEWLSKHFKWIEKDVKKLMYTAWCARGKLERDELKKEEWTEEERQKDLVNDGLTCVVKFCRNPRCYHSPLCLTHLNEKRK